MPGLKLKIAIYARKKKIISFPYQPLSLPPTYSSLPSALPHYKAKSGELVTGVESGCVALDYVYHLNCFTCYKML